MRAVLAIDVEPNGRTPQPGVATDWSGAELLLDGTDWARERFGTPVINWFLRIDEQVKVLHGRDEWAAEHFAGRLGELVAHGDEVGVHPHPWRWSNGWVADGGADWAVENAERSLEGFRSVFGAHPASFRYGDRYVDRAVIARLLDYPDVRVDLTTEPGTRTVRALDDGYSTVGVLRHVDPACSHRYHPAPDHPEIAVAHGSLTMLPLTTGVIAGTGQVDTLHLWRNPAEFAETLRVRLLDPGLDHLAFAIRSDVSQLPQALEVIATNLEHVRRTVPGLVWVRASDLALGDDEATTSAIGPIGAFARRDAMLAIEVDEVRRRLVAVETQLSVERERASAVASAATDALDAAAATDVRLRAIEATATWRLRSRLLLVLRPVSHVGRRLRSRFRS